MMPLFQSDEQDLIESKHNVLSEQLKMPTISFINSGQSEMFYESTGRSCKWAWMAT